jgi:hypothetical protein
MDNNQRNKRNSNSASASLRQQWRAGAAEALVSLAP